MHYDDKELFFEIIYFSQLFFYPDGKVQFRKMITRKKKMQCGK